MKVGAKNSGSQSPILADRTRRTLEYALLRLRTSELAPYIKHVYLYGSCARKTQTYESDVDLLVELDENTDMEKYRQSIMELKGTISPVSLELPDVDMHVVAGTQWKNSRLLYYQNIRKEGMDVWDMQQDAWERHRKRMTEGI